MDNNFEFSGGKRPITVFHRLGSVPTTQLGHLSLHSEVHKRTSDSAWFNIHSVKWFPYVGHWHNFRGFEWNQRWPT